MIALHKVNFFAILEPMYSKIDNFKRKIPLGNHIINEEDSKIWIFEKDSI